LEAATFMNETAAASPWFEVIVHELFERGVGLGAH
jgi:hypothetical protein